MKTRARIYLIAVVAAAIIFGQWALAMGNDHFTLSTSTNHKVFTYGFPFPIIECAPELPMHTPGWQIPLRIAGNFTAFLGAGGLAILMIQRFRAKDIPA
jgi:hypothetical protein